MPITRKPRQTRLTFTPLPSSSPTAKDYNKQIQERAAQVCYSGSHGSSKRRKLQESDREANGLGNALRDGANHDLPTPAATMDRRTGDEMSARPPTSKSGMFGTQSRTRSVKQKPVVGVSDEQESALEDEDKLPARKAKIAVRRRSQKQVALDSDDEDQVAVNDTFEAGRRDSEGGDSGEDIPTTQGKLPRRKRARSPDSFISSSPPRAVDSDSDLEIVSAPRKWHQSQDSEDKEIGEDERITRSGQSRLKRKARRLTQQDHKDLAEDLDFLDPSSDVEALERAPQSTQSKAKSAREAALARLKRKRSGQTQAEPTMVEEEEPSQEEDEPEEAFGQPASSRRIFEPGDEDEDFIVEVEEGDGLLGIPDGMPIEFTHYARKKPKELFKYAVEWMVQKNINPGFNMYDEIYELTFRKLDDELHGLAGSKFLSAAWTPQFTMALKARPEIAIDSIGGDFPAHCDACNRSNHPATFEIQFQGKPYHPYTLEPVTAGADERDEGENDSDTSSTSSNSSNDDEPGYDYQGNEIAPANKIYQVGKFCKANAATAHDLQHWKWHLNAYVELWLARNGYLTDEKRAKRDKASSRKRKREGNKLTDAMERQGEIRGLWDLFKRNVDAARSSKQGRFSSFDSP